MRDWRVFLVVPPGGRFRDIRRIELGPRTLTLGRAEGCDVQIDVPGVDLEHARLSSVALVALVPDCAVGDVPLDTGARRLVMAGDEIQLGSVVLALEGDEPSLIGSNVPPRVRVVEGTNFGDELVLDREDTDYVIGRGAECNLVLDDREVSREHVKVRRRGFSIFVQDLSSTRGSWLGRSAVYTGGAAEWTRPRMLRVGATVLTLALPDEVRKAIPGAQVSAPMTPAPRERGFGSPAVPGLSPAASSSKLLAAQQAALPPPQDPTPPPVTMPSATAPSGSHEEPTMRRRAPKVGQRRAWKSTGPRIGKVSGFLLLLLAGVAILGALFFVFSLLE